MVNKRNLFNAFSPGQPELVKSTHHPVSTSIMWSLWSCLPLISCLHFYGLAHQMHTDANNLSHCQRLFC